MGRKNRRISQFNGNCALTVEKKKEGPFNKIK